MVMRAEDLAAFSGNGLEAECSSRSAAGRDAYGFDVLTGIHVAGDNPG